MIHSADKFTPLPQSSDGSELDVEPESLEHLLEGMIEELKKLTGNLRGTRGHFVGPLDKLREADRVALLSLLHGLDSVIIKLMLLLIQAEVRILGRV